MPCRSSLYETSFPKSDTGPFLPVALWANSWTRQSLDDRVRQWRLKDSALGQMSVRQIAVMFDSKELIRGRQRRLTRVVYQTAVSLPGSYA